MTIHRGLIATAFSLAIGCGGSAPGELSGKLVAESAMREETLCEGKVNRRGNTFLIAPSGGDDTANLQCALNTAAETGRPITVRLAAGTFVTKPLHVTNLRGALRGAGKGVTVLTNPDTPVYVTPVFQPNPPSATNIWPGMLVFVGGDFTVSDLTVRVRGARPTLGWEVFGLVLQNYAVGIDVEGNGGAARAAFERVAVIGELVPDDPNGFGANIINGIYFQGMIGFPTAPPPSTSGAFNVHDCEIRNVASGTPTFNLRDARVHIEGNTYETTFDATEIGDSTGLAFVFASNHVTAGYSAYTPFDICLGSPAGCGLTDSKILFAGNRVKAPVGFDLNYGPSSPGPFADVGCRIVGNQITYEQFAVHLGPRTNHCLVETTGAVWNEGTDNRVVGP